jgi:hypothetical protein
VSKDALKDLQDRLVGKRIVAVEPANATEGVCLFKTDDGQSFRLHATDLGFWTEDTVGEDGYYPSLHALMVEYSYHNHDISPGYNYNPPDAKAVFKDGVLTVRSPKKREFKIREAKLTPWELTVAKDKAGPRLLGFAALMGDAWRTPFTGSYEGCPKRLVLLPTMTP